jgi:hypothetical protein
VFLEERGKRGCLIGVPRLHPAQDGQFRAEIGRRRVQGLNHCLAHQRLKFVIHDGPVRMVSSQASGSLDRL